MTRPAASVASMMNFVISSVPAAVTNRSSPPRSVAPALQRPLGSLSRPCNPLERFPGPTDTVENRGAKADRTIPATAVLGAILVTGFLGGAICAHVRIGELGSPPELISLLLGAMTWGGLYARDPRIRAILPLIR